MGADHLVRLFRGETPQPHHRRERPRRQKRLAWEVFLPGIRVQASADDLHFLPEGDIVAEILAHALERGRVRSEVAPVTIPQQRVALLHAEILALALPQTGVLGVALLEQLAVDARQRKIPIALGADQILLGHLGDHDVVQYGLHGKPPTDSQRNAQESDSPNIGADATRSIPPAMTRRVRPAPLAFAR